MTSGQTVVRCYALICNDLDEVLISDEKQGEWTFTKFPGGGLEFGEGIKECVQRELKEELNLECEVGELFYVNDFFQASALHTNKQLIAFYFLVTLNTRNTDYRTNYEVPILDEGEKQRWVKIDELNEEMFTFPIDRLVVKKLIEKKNFNK